MIAKILCKKNIMPEYVTFFITNKCNCKCKHCFFWRELNTIKDELKLEEIEKISRSMGKFPVLSLTGGEPFLRKDIFWIIKVFYINNKIRYLVLPTNGTIPIKKLVERVLRECPNLQVRVFVSIDSIGKEHDKVRGVKGVFDKAIKTFRSLGDIKSKNLKLGTTTVFSRFNEKEIFKIYTWLRSNLKPDLTNFPIVRGDVKDKSIKDVDIEIYRKLMKNVNRQLKGDLIKSAKEIMTDLNIRIVKENRYITPCYAGSANAVIYANGDVYPCEMLDMKMGNIRDFNYNFKKLWFSAKAKGVRANIIKQKCFCTHGCNMLPNVIFNPRYYPRIILNFIKELLK